MPIGTGGAAIIQAGSGVIGAAMSNRANRRASDLQYERNQEQWNRQNTRDDSLWARQNAHNLDMWNMNNKYNSPLEQMARFKEAGLNPHLIYGKGTSGNSSAMQQAQQKSQSVQGYSRNQSENVLRGMNVFSQQAQLKNLQAQTDNTEAHTDIAKQDLVNKAIDSKLKLLQEQLLTTKDEKTKKILQFQIQQAEKQVILQQSKIGLTNRQSIGQHQKNIQGYFGGSNNDYMKVLTSPFMQDAGNKSLELMKGWYKSITK